MAKYMFSEECNLLCRDYGNEYYVINGAWTMQMEKVQEIKDWVEVDPTTWTHEKQRQWYFR